METLTQRKEPIAEEVRNLQQLKVVSVREVIGILGYDESADEITLKTDEQDYFLSTGIKVNLILQNGEEVEVFLRDKRGYVKGKRICGKYLSNYDNLQEIPLTTAIGCKVKAKLLCIE